jgi:hypothetical protein
MKPVDPKFVNSLMENIYGNDEDIVKHQSCEDAEKAVEKHATTMENFGIPKNIGNAWKAPKAPEPKSQKLEDHAEEGKSLTESVDPMDERVTNIEEGPSNADLNKIDNEHHEDTAVGAQGEAAEGDDDVPVGNRGEGKTAKLSHLLKGSKKGSAKEKELRMKARGHKLTKKQGKPGNQKMSKKEIAELAGK